VYFTFGDWNWAGGRQHRLRGHTTGICVVEGANPANFREVGKLEGRGNPEGIIYQSGKRKYFHSTYISNKDNHPGLSLFEADGTIEDLPVDRALSKFTEDKDLSSEISLKAFVKLFKVDTDYNDH
jgi:hypothetical protein